jgi:hypothetical protein
MKKLLLLSLLAVLFLTMKVGGAHATWCCPQPTCRPIRYFDPPTLREPQAPREVSLARPLPTHRPFPTFPPFPDHSCACW